MRLELTLKQKQDTFMSTAPELTLLHKRRRLEQIKLHGTYHPCPRWIRKDKEGSRDTHGALKQKMETYGRSIVGLFLVCAAFAPCVALDSSACMELGYTSGLMCSSCRELREFNLQSLEGECNQCCQPDGPNTDDKV